MAAILSWAWEPLPSRVWDVLKATDCLDVEVRGGDDFCRVVQAARKEEANKIKVGGSNQACIIHKPNIDLSLLNPFNQFSSS
jgi:hypothetical protein